jgi:hypothetical protein
VSQAAASEAASTPEEPGTRPPGVGKTVADLARSLLPLLAIILVVVWVRSPGGDPVHVIDPSDDLRAATEVAPYPVASAHGLPAGWRPTSSHLTRPATRVVTVEVGYLSPAGRYARYAESNLGLADLIDAQVPGSTAAGTASVNGRTWRRYTTDAGETALVLPGERVSLLVTGSAGLAELTTLAASLR